MITPETKWKVATGFLALGALVILVLFGKEVLENGLLQREMDGLEQ